MKTLILNITISILASLLFNSCKDTAQAYLGTYLQPQFDDNSYVPGLNIFGILRTDSTGNFNNSFVEIQKVMSAVAEDDSLSVGDVIVTVKRYTLAGETDSYNFILTNYDSIFSDTYYRPAISLNTDPGDIFSIECDYPDLPVLTAHTIIPDKASIVPETYNQTSEGLFFEIKDDSTFYMLDVYFYKHNTLIASNRYATETGINTSVDVPLTSIKIDSVVIYSYDYNMAKYCLSSNTSLNFNKYRNSFSTVDNGYGVFGSLNKIGIRLDSLK